MSSDPFCVYQPAAWHARRLSAKPQAENGEPQKYLN
jgi:hypothetical protein